MFVPTDAIKSAVEGNEAVVLDRLQIAWHPGRHRRCPYPYHDDRNPSWRWDPRTRRAHCSCQTPGQADNIFDIVGKVCGVDFEGAKLFAAEAIGRPDLIRGQGQRRPAQPVPPPSPTPVDETAKQRRAWALEMWAKAERDTAPLLPYWREYRGLVIEIPVTIRYLPSTFHKATGLWFPAMLAVVQAGDRRPVAVHRTLLTPDRTRKAGVAKPKLALGDIGDGAVRLVPAAEIMGLSEGIENAAAAMQLTGIPCWAALGRRFHNVALPGLVRELHIFADPGQPGEQAALTGAETHTARGRRVIVRYPPEGDWNDQARGGATA